MKLSPSATNREAHPPADLRRTDTASRAASAQADALWRIDPERWLMERDSKSSEPGVSRADGIHRDDGLDERWEVKSDEGVLREGSNEGREGELDLFLKTPSSPPAFPPPTARLS